MVCRASGCLHSPDLHPHLSQQTDATHHRCHAYTRKELGNRMQHCHLSCIRIPSTSSNMHGHMQQWSFPKPCRTTVSPSPSTPYIQNTRTLKEPSHTQMQCGNQPHGSCCNKYSATRSLLCVPWHRISTVRQVFTTIDHGIHRPGFILGFHERSCE